MWHEVVPMPSMLFLRLLSWYTYDAETENQAHKPFAYLFLFVPFVLCFPSSIFHTLTPWRILLGNFWFVLYNKDITNNIGVRYLPGWLRVDPAGLPDWERQSETIYFSQGPRGSISNKPWTVFGQHRSVRVDAASCPSSSGSSLASTGWDTWHTETPWTPGQRRISTLCDH